MFIGASFLIRVSIFIFSTLMATPSEVEVLSCLGVEQLELFIGSSFLIILSFFSFSTFQPFQPFFYLVLPYLIDLLNIHFSEKVCRYFRVMLFHIAEETSII